MRPPNWNLDSKTLCCWVGQEQYHDALIVFQPCLQILESRIEKVVEAQIFGYHWFLWEAFVVVVGCLDIKNHLILTHHLTRAIRVVTG